MHQEERSTRDEKINVVVEKATDPKSGDEDTDEEGETEQEPAAELDFTPEQCLFCNTTSPTFEENVAHMSKRHGLFIPDDERLVVELETLVRYLHLVVFGYFECLSCHTQRQNAHAVQQHMIGKGHCRFDIDDEESEYADFYSLSGDEELASDEDVGGSSEDGPDGGPSTRNKTEKAPFKLDDKSLRLSSGKILSHRTAPPPKTHRPLAETHPAVRRGPDHALPQSAPASASASTPEPTITTSSDDTTLAPNRAERRGATTLTTALAKLSLNDRTALAHLPPAQQRAIVLAQFKQQDRQRTAARRYWSKVELNKTAKH